MAVSEYTKKCRAKLWLYRILDWLCLFAPVIIYVVIALCDGGVVATGKIAVVGTVTIALVLTAINVLAQKRLRCPIWIVLLGLYVAIKEYLLPLIIILAITSILDDLVFTPLITYYYTATVSSKTMDARQEAESHE